MVIASKFKYMHLQLHKTIYSLMDIAEYRDNDTVRTETVMLRRSLR